MCLLFALLFFLTLVLFGLLLPLWAIFDCMLSNALECVFRNDLPGEPGNVIPGETENWFSS